MTTWIVDPIHSEIQFKAKHMVISTVTGSFLEFSGKMEVPFGQQNNFENSEVSFEIQVNSLDTGVEQRDEHLRSADFFDVEDYPKITFKSTSFKKDDHDTYIIEGNLTMKATTKPVSLQVEYGGTAVDMYGQTKAGFELRGKVNRQEYGLVWSATTEEGAVVVSDEIRLVAELQFTKQE